MTLSAPWSIKRVFGEGAMRIMASICLGVLLASCNMVTSQTPLFSSADTQGQAQFRSGIWMDEDKTCVVDTSKPIGEWPDCADAWVVHPGQILAGRDAKAPPSTWESYKTLLTTGNPAVLQVEVGPESDGPKGYVYVGVRTLKTDAQGRIIEYKAWPALCGPPPKPDPTGEKSAVISDQLIAGLVADKDKQDCIASAQGPVRVAVVQSEALGGDEDNRGRNTAHWVRDGDK
jgi:hypothetical protein